MKSVERNYNKTVEKNPRHSTYICFTMATAGKNFTRRTLLKHFNNLVDPEDYEKSEKRNLIDQIHRRSQEVK